MEDDKIVATPILKEKLDAKKLKKMLRRRKRHRNFQPCPMVRTEIAAYDTKSSIVVQSERHEHSVGVEDEEMIDTTKGTQNSDKPRMQLSYAKSKFILKEMDFNHLECLVLAQGNEDHH